MLQINVNRAFIFGSHFGMFFPRMTSFIENSRWRPDLLKACIAAVVCELTNMSELLSVRKTEL